MFERILVATDGSAGSNEATDRAAALAELTGAILHVVSVASPVYRGGRLLAETTEKLENEADDIVAAAAERAAGRDIEVTTATRRGEPHRELEAYAREHDIDCVVVSRHGRGEGERYMLGKVSGRVVRSLSIPVLVVGE